MRQPHIQRKDKSTMASATSGRFLALASRMKMDIRLLELTSVARMAQVACIERMSEQSASFCHRIWAGSRSVRCPLNQG